VADTVAGMTDEQTVDLILSMTKKGRDAHRSRTQTIYDPAYETYRAQPRKKPALPGWRSQVRVPYAQSSLDTALVNIVSGAPKCVVTPRHPDDVDASRAMQAAMDYYVAEDHLVERQPLFAQQGLVMGVTVAKVYWAYAETTIRKRVWLPDENGELRQTRVETVENAAVKDAPCFEPWSVYDCYWDPNGRDVDTCSYVALESWMSKDEIEKHRFNPDTRVGWRNLDEFLETAPSKRRADSYQDVYLGQLNRRKGQFKVTEILTDEATFTIGNDKVLLEAKPNPYWHGKKCVVIAQTRPDLFEMQGIPEVDMLRDIQDALHTLQNMTIDSIHLSVMRFATYRVGSVVDPNMIVIRPQGKIPVDNHDDVQFPVVPPVTNDVFTERERLLADMERVTGVSAYLSGADSNSVDQTTATGVTTLQNAANALMRFKAGQLHYKGFQRMFEMWGSMIQQYQTRDLWAEIADPKTGEAAWAKISPHDVAGDFHYRLVGSEENLSRQTARNESSALLAALFPYVQLGLVDPTPLILQLGQAYEVPNPQALIKPPAPPMPAPQPGGNGQVPPGGPQMPQALPFGGSMPQAVQQAIGQR
jgi:hypothetical protein